MDILLVQLSYKLILHLEEKIIVAIMSIKISKDKHKLISVSSMWIVYA
jgi:hypothetical protein